MSEVLKITEAFVAKEYSTIRYRGCDGYETARHFDVVVVKTEDGREFAMPNGRKVVDEDGFAGAMATYDADALLPQVQAKGVIRTAYWVELEPEESFEERYAPFGPAWQEEQAARGGFFR